MGRRSGCLRAVSPKSLSPSPSPPRSRGDRSRSPVVSSPPESPAPVKAVRDSAVARRDTLRPVLRSPPPVSRGSASRAAASDAEAATSPAVFTFKGRDGAADDRRVLSRGTGSRDAESPSGGHWTLPPCRVTVRPRDRARFWEDVRAKAEALSSRGSARRPLQGKDGSSSSARAARRALAPVPVEHAGHDSEDDDGSPARLQAFPVVKDAGRKKHAHLSWQALVDLRDRIGKHGLGSPEMMHTLRLIDTDVLPPYDIRCLAKVLFQPVEYDMFESKWTQLAETAAAQNRMARQDDPRYGVGPDVLTGVGEFSDVNKQITYEPLVLEQSQRLGMAALVQTMEVAAPKQTFTTIFQGPDEPFLRFADRLTASVERQVDDLTARGVLLATVARSNCNAECRKIIEALPGKPSFMQMVEACSKTGTTGASVKLGKRAAEREGEARSDTSVFPIPRADGDLLGKLTASTCGSAGVDVCTAETVVLRDTTVHKIPLDAFGPLGDGLSALLMGRSSTTIQGIIVHLGLVDADYTGRIYAMVSTSTPPLTIPEKTRIAQLVPFKSSVPRAESQVRGDGGFGSTGPPQVFWTDVLSKKRRPEKTCTLSLPGATPSEIHLRGTLDTGADITIVSIAAWPPDWPLDPVRTPVAGLGGTKHCYVSQKPVTITNPEGQAAVVRPHVTDTPANLWGRDALAAWGVRMGTDF
ncbi:hypothetical protein HGM15179_011999 [Zosterops borbonicus]|uniref:Peptidase A2 domain-containing protein n=1 Tax=Zosterops borbonicus TaxID=364589 RepID=A0A8K1LIE9_9PASS|nr:hypothetical protein HGM15179_011999 [Zosterops borbonicus]